MGANGVPVTATEPGALVKWLVAPGSYVARYQPVAFIHNADGGLDVTAPVAGIIYEMRRPSLVRPTHVIARIEQPEPFMRRRGKQRQLAVAPEPEPAPEPVPEPQEEVEEAPEPQSVPEPVRSAYKLTGATSRETYHLDNAERDYVKELAKNHGLNKSHVVRVMIWSFSRLELREREQLVEEWQGVPGPSPTGETG